MSKFGWWVGVGVELPACGHIRFEGGEGDAQSDLQERHFICSPAYTIQHCCIEAFFPTVPPSAPHAISLGNACGSQQHA